MNGIRLSETTAPAEEVACTGGTQVTVSAHSRGNDLQLSLESVRMDDKTWQAYSCGSASTGELDVDSVMVAIDLIERLALRAQAKKKFGTGGLQAAKKALAEATAQVTALSANLACDTAEQCRSDRWGTCGELLALSSTKVLAAADIDNRFTQVNVAQKDIDALEDLGPRACPAIAYTPPTLVCTSGTCASQ